VSLPRHNYLIRDVFTCCGVFPFHDLRHLRAECTSRPFQESIKTLSDNPRYVIPGDVIRNLFVAGPRPASMQFFSGATQPTKDFFFGAAITRNYDLLAFKLI
jgi:hypothetical protein